jgi:probable phosphoglycerate mutase
VLGNTPVEIDPLFNERRLGQWNNRPIAETEELLAAKVTPPGGEAEDDFTKRVSAAMDNLRPHLDRRPLLVSSKGVGRVLNGCSAARAACRSATARSWNSRSLATTASKVLKVARPHQA